MHEDDGLLKWEDKRAGTKRGAIGFQTWPDKSWNTLFRLYGLLEPWFDKSWKPGDSELVK